MKERILFDFEDLLRKHYNIDHEGNEWYHFSKGRGNFQGGVKNETFIISLELFIIDPTALAHLEKDIKKANKALETCTIERQGNSVWVTTSLPFNEVNTASMKDMIENCLSAAKTKTVWNLETQHKKAPLRF